MKKIIFLFCFSIACDGHSQSWQWARMVDSVQNIPHSLATDNLGNFYLAGEHYDNNTGTWTGQSLAKFDSQGNLLWNRNFSSTLNVSQIVSLNNDVFLVGSFSDTCILGNNILVSNGGQDILLARLDGAGNVVWAKNFGGANDDQGNGICSDGNGRLYITGLYSGAVSFGNFNFISQGKFNLFITRLDASGNVLFAKSAGSQDTTGSIGEKIKTDAAGNIVILGTIGDIQLDTLHLAGGWWYSGTYSCDQHFICKLDSQLNAQWIKMVEFYFTTHTSDILIDKNDDIVFIQNDQWTGGSSAYIQQYSAQRQPIWEASWIADACRGYDFGGFALQNGKIHMVAIGGSSNCTHYEYFLRIQYDSVGNQVFIDSVLLQSTSSAGVSALQIAADANGDMIVCGTLGYGKITLGNYLLQAPQKQELFIAKYGTGSLNAIHSNIDKENIRISPNPTTGALSITGEYSEIVIYDLLGNKIKTFTPSNNIPVNISGMSNGIYFVNIRTKNGTITKQVVLQN